MTVMINLRYVFNGRVDRINFDVSNPDYLASEDFDSLLVTINGVEYQSTLPDDVITWTMSDGSININLVLGGLGIEVGIWDVVIVGITGTDTLTIVSPWLTATQLKVEVIEPITSTVGIVGDDDVRCIKPSSTIKDYTPFIFTAKCIIEQLVATPCGAALSDGCLVQVQTYLAAHYASVMDPVVSKEKFENSDLTFQRGKEGSGLMSTQYGQMAVALSGGCLTELDKRASSIDFFGGDC